MLKFKKGAGTSDLAVVEMRRSLAQSKCGNGLVAGVVGVAGEDGGGAVELLG